MRSLGLLVLLFLVACSESFLPAWAVQDLRVVGARVEVDGQPERARPDPGDEVEVSMLVVDLGAPPPPPEMPDIPALTPALLQWAFAACVPEATLIGPPICRDVLQPCDGCLGTPPPDRFDFPVVRFEVPSETELEAAQADRVVLQGVVCIHGVPSLDAIQRFLLGQSDDLVPCVQDPDVTPRPGDPEPEGRFVSTSVFIEPTPEDPNLNPEILNVTLNGSAWPPPYHEGVPRTAPREGCVDDLEPLTDEERAAHPVAGSQPSSINLFMTNESLQSYMVGDMTLTEEIQVSWLTDGGGLERTFSFISEKPATVLTQWQPFPEVSEDGVLVRFTFVTRDGRGGTDWVERGLCVLPAPPVESPP